MYRMAVKAIVVDGDKIQHLIIGLNREDVESLLRGDVLTLPSGQVPVLTEDKSDIVLLFAETDEDLGRRLPTSTPTGIGGNRPEKGRDGSVGMSELVRRYLPIFLP